MGDASRSDVCPYRQTKGVFPSVYGGTTGIRTLFSRHRTEIQLRNPLRNRGKSGVNRGGRVGRLRVKLHHFDPCRPPRKGFESLRFRQVPSNDAPSGAFFVFCRPFCRPFFQRWRHCSRTFLKWLNRVVSDWVRYLKVRSQHDRGDSRRPASA